MTTLITCLFLWAIKSFMVSSSCKISRNRTISWSVQFGFRFRLSLKPCGPSPSGRGLKNTELFSKKLIFLPQYLNYRSLLHPVISCYLNTLKFVFNYFCKNIEECVMIYFLLVFLRNRNKSYLLLTRHATSSVVAQSSLV